MKPPKSGFREIEHTADWELEVWAPDLEGLLEQSARGMNTLTGMCLEEAPRQSHSIVIHASDPESLLVNFLSELLYLGEQEGLGFDSFQLHLDGYQLHARLEGAAIQIVLKEIKAVTFHRLHIRETECGLKVSIVFDV